MEPEASAPRETAVGRRVFLGLAAFGTAGVRFGSQIQGWLERNVGPILAKDPTGLLQLLPIGNFRIYSVTTDLPYRSRSKYRLTVKGLVDREVVLTFDDLKSMTRTRLVRDFQCVTGWRVPQVEWAGVRLADVLDRAGVQPDARAVRFVSFDGAYTESLTLPEARRADVIVAYEMEHQPLSTEHGGPARLYVAPMYGYKSCKWLETIELTRSVEPGYWEQRGYSVEGWVGHSNHRDDERTS
jgi:DMSO/TMAO reductase YedYZ molybdopterin-dependent catalytic subunit